MSKSVRRERTSVYLAQWANVRSTENFENPECNGISGWTRIRAFARLSRAKIEEVWNVVGEGEIFVVVDTAYTKLPDRRL